MKVITTVVGSLQTNCYLLIDEETKCAALIDPGDEAEKLLALIKSEGVTLKYILLTHGHRDHTLGGVTLLVGDAMFPGDTLFAGSMGRTDLPGGNDAQMLLSLRRLGELKEDYTVYPGHMNTTTLAREKAMNPYLRQALR